jgi:hypothetical protein
MIPLESSARAITLMALPNALCVTAYTWAGSRVGIAAWRMSTASCIWRPCAFAAAHRHRSARLRINGRTASARDVIGPFSAGQPRWTLAARFAGTKRG